MVVYLLKPLHVSANPRSTSERRFGTDVVEPTELGRFALWIKDILYNEDF
jgi:hypothetical protein